MNSVGTLLASDALIPTLLLLSLALLSLRLFPNVRSLHDVTSLLLERSTLKTNFNRKSPFSPQRATAAYAQYEELAGRDIRLMRRSYGRLGRTHKRIGYELGYPQKLERLVEVTRANAEVTSAIARMAGNEPQYATSSFLSTYALDGRDLGRVREALKHFVRDWSEEGRDERSRIFSPILEVLGAVQPEERAAMKVLVPGCGLGRLAWEIAELGFDTTANELSSFMTLALRFLLSPATTQRPAQHTLHPYAHWFSHQRTAGALFRAVAFPDVVPRLSPRLHLDAGDFLRLAPPLDSPGYDFVVTLFFIDTALDAAATLAQVHRLLRPGGTWLNLGPLLWTGGAQAAMELSLDEVLRLAALVGFAVEDGSRRSVQCEYTADKEAMMKWIYEAEFWVARRLG